MSKLSTIRTRRHVVVVVGYIAFMVLLASQCCLAVPHLKLRHFADPISVGIQSAMNNRRGRNVFVPPAAAHAVDKSENSIDRTRLSTTRKEDSKTKRRILSLQGRPEKTAANSLDNDSLHTTTTLKDATSMTTRGGSSMAAAASFRPLLFWENMVAGAVSRSVAQTVMHPANTMKTLLQSNADSTIRQLSQPKNFQMLTRGAGANFVLSVPHGAVNFAVLEFIRERMDALVQATPPLQKRRDSIGPGLDFLSSAISTICCSIVSTPQMMITDNIMAGNYRNMPSAISGLARERGLAGFYGGWWPGLAGKIPSYALTWTLFQQLKTAHRQLVKRDAKDIENSIMGCVASATTVCIMIPMDTIKTRLVTQTLHQTGGTAYKGIADCAIRILREEGASAFYRGLPPRLVSVVPMIGIQFGVYEFMKKVMVSRSMETNLEMNQQNRNKQNNKKKQHKTAVEAYGDREAFQEAAMEVAADDDQPFPAPHFKSKYLPKKKKKKHPSNHKTKHKLKAK